MKYFLLYLFLEVMISVNIASAIGGFATFFVIVGSAFLGIVLLINFRLSLMMHLQALAQRQISLGMFEQLNLWGVLGAFLLILPGFLTDILGVVMQFSVVTTLFASKALHVRKGENPTPFQRGYDDEIIDVDVIDDRSVKQ